MTPAGLLRHRVTHERYTVTDDMGQDVQSHVAVGTYWAYVEPTSGSESSDESGTSAVVTHRVRLRYGPTIRPKDRLIFRGRTLNITSVVNVGEANTELLLTCEEAV